MSLVIPVNARTSSPFDLKPESHFSLLFLLFVTPKLTGKEARTSPLMRLEWHFLLIGITQAREKLSVRSELVTLCLLSSASTQSRANPLLGLFLHIFWVPFCLLLGSNLLFSYLSESSSPWLLVKSNLGSHSAVLKLFICKRF